MKAIFAGATVCFLLSVAPLHAQVPAQAQSYGVLGVGNQSCGWWTNARRTEGPEGIDQVQAMDWLGGFVSATNAYVIRGGHMNSGTDIQGLAGWIDNYCAANPLDTYAAAVSKLMLYIDARHP